MRTRATQKGLVSVIIPKTKSEDVSECVNAVNDSTYKNIEIIVVDEGLERSAQRNIGISRASGEYYLFVDSDQFISHKLIWDCINKICPTRGEYHYSSIYIPEIIITNGWFASLRNWERQFYTGTEIDCVRFVAAKYCQLFDETMSGPEDSDWDKRIAGRRTISDSYFYHRDNIGIIQYFKKKAYYTKSMGRYAKRWQHAKVLDFKYRCFGVFFENGKWKRFLGNPIKAIGVYIIIFIRGLIYLCVKKLP